MLDIPFQERYEPDGKSPEEKSKNDQRLKKTNQPGLQGKIERSGAVYSLAGKMRQGYSFQMCGR